jgi:hypothetical protein
MFSLIQEDTPTEYEQPTTTIHTATGPCTVPHIHKLGTFIMDQYKVRSFSMGNVHT